MNSKTSELLKLKNIIFILLLSFLLGGCAVGTTELVVSHNELNILVIIHDKDIWELVAV